MTRIEMMVLVSIAGCLGFSGTLNPRAGWIVLWLTAIVFMAGDLIWGWLPE